MIMGKKQHFIPQFYLRNFSDINQKSIGLFRFIERKYIKNASIGDIAYRNRFYDDDNSIEILLSKIEGRWKRILDVFLGKDITKDTLKWIEENKTDIINDLFLFFAITNARIA
jgi:hypothetical protein